MNNKKDEKIKSSNLFIFRCPKCYSSKIAAIHPFDYMKRCKDCGNEFSGYPHN